MNNVDVRRNGSYVTGIVIWSRGKITTVVILSRYTGSWQTDRRTGRHVALAKTRASG